ncbi:Uncharacterised protein [Salmonella enterica subsp. enterica serovar Typhi]|nr:Uncharacterised protein [Salmonella enterica subsp. enterica serovar Typhi]
MTIFVDFLFCFSQQFLPLLRGILFNNPLNIRLVIMKFKTQLVILISISIF